MCLRADAPVFIPGAAATDAQVLGDRLIQELAAAMTPSRSDAPGCMLPVAGIFCPYCIAGVACAFHKPAVPASGKATLPNANGYKLDGARSSKAHAHLAEPRLFNIDMVSQPTESDSTVWPQAERATGGRMAFVKQREAALQVVLDANSDAPDSEEVSTDASSSEAWCAASDASDLSPTLQVDGSVIADSRDTIRYTDKEVGLYGARWGGRASRAPIHAQSGSRTLAR